MRDGDHLTVVSLLQQWQRHRRLHSVSARQCVPECAGQYPQASRPGQDIIATLRIVRHIDR